MPPIFKVLATISVWILFVFGCIDLLGGMFGYIRVGLGGHVPLGIQAVWAAGTVSIFVAVAAAKLRQMME
ncbi:hypothetical protein ACFLVX_01335 [Chloroflexota bacterium]